MDGLVLLTERKKLRKAFAQSIFEREYLNEMSSIIWALKRIAYVVSNLPLNVLWQYVVQVSSDIFRKIALSRKVLVMVRWQKVREEDHR